MIVLLMNFWNKGYHIICPIIWTANRKGVRRVESTIKVHEDEVCIKTEKTEITHTKEAISVSAPKINLESDKLSRQL